MVGRVSEMKWNAQLQERGPDYNLDFAARRGRSLPSPGMRRPWWTLRGLLTTRIPSGTRRCSGRQTSDAVAPLEPRNHAECGRRFPPSGLRWSVGEPRGALRKPILRNGLGEIGPPVFLADRLVLPPFPAICQRRPQVSRGWRAAIRKLPDGRRGSAVMAAYRGSCRDPERFALASDWEHLVGA